MPNPYELSQVLESTITKVLTEKGLKTDLTLDSPIDRSLGLDSLDWAAVAVHMEDQTGLDPFSEGFLGELRTIKDLLALYEQTANKHSPPK